jgi:chemotaxis protein methyltransferase CheR
MNDNEVLLYFAQWIERETGIIYENHNLYQLQDRLDQLVRVFNLTSKTELWKKAQSGIEGEFRRSLIDISTNNETSFFRDGKFFECLEKTLLPELVKERGGLSVLKIWSVASSTGQEPYSLAMIVSDMAAKLGQPAPHILATDISERVIAKAKQGVFSDIEVQRGLSPERRDRYFKMNANKTWNLDPKVCSMVDFRKLNLKDNFSLETSFDLILCRNVLIYQRVPAKIDMIKKITKNLRPGGVFLMGSGESLIGLTTDLQQKLVDGVAVFSHSVTLGKAA